jgi:hypothetical protein
MNYLPGLALNIDPPDLSFPSSKDYKCEPPVLSFYYVLYKLFQALNGRVCL